MTLHAPAYQRPSALRAKEIERFYRREVIGDDVRQITTIGHGPADTLLASQWHGSFDTPIPQKPQDHSVLVLHMGGGSVEGRHNQAGSCDIRAKRGSVTLHSDNAPVYWRSEGTVDYMHVYLPTADINAQAAALGGASGISDIGAEVTSDKALIHSLQALRMAAKAGQMNPMELTGWTHMIVGQALRVFGGSAQKQTKLDAHPLADAMLAKIRALIEDRIDEKITLDEMAALTGWDVYRFSRAFRNTVGQPPHQYILGRRIERAREMLSASNDPLSEIAYANGFSSLQHMTNLFSKHLGISPAKYRQQARM